MNETTIYVFCEAVTAQFVHGPQFCRQPATCVVSFDTSSPEDTFPACAEHGEPFLVDDALTDANVYKLPVEIPREPSIYEDSAVREAIREEINRSQRRSAL